MTAPEAILTQVFTTIFADTGATGLTNTSSPANLQQVVREGDAEQLSRTDLPSLYADVAENNISPVYGGGIEAYHCRVRLVVTAYRDQGQKGYSTVTSAPRATIDAVIGRIQSVFNGLALSALSDTDDSGRKWYFGQMWPDGSPGNPQLTSRHVRQPITFTVYAFKGLS